MAQIGDIAIVGFSADAVGPTQKSFSFVILADLSGQTLNFTDNGWLSTGGFRSGEGSTSYVVSSFLPIGTVVTIGGLTGTFNPSTSGDSIIAYTGAQTSANLLYGVDFADGDSVWEPTASNSTTSAAPSVLVSANAALAFSTDNGTYSGPLVGTKAQILAAIATTSNWTLDDATSLTYPSSFTVYSDTAPGSFTIADKSVAEGNSGTTAMIFTVNRPGGNFGAADVSYVVALDGTAAASDFVGGAPASGIVHFADGQNSATITINVAGDTTFEPNETFHVSLTGTTTGTIGAAATATGTITNDDVAPAGTFSIASASANEGDSGSSAISFTVSRASGSAGAADVAYSVLLNGTANAADFASTVPTTGTVHFNDGDAADKVITLQIQGDTVYEVNETFSVRLDSTTAGSIATATATGTITNDDPMPPPAPLFINEIHYDNVGTDTGEAIEIAGPAGTDLTGWSIVRYNGNGGVVYTSPAQSSPALSGTIPDQGNGYGTVVVTYPQDGLQNGPPDGIALVAPNGQAVQFLSYEGVIVASGGPADGMTSIDIGVSEESGPLGQSLQLTGTGAVGSDFTWQPDATSSFGQINPGQSFLPAVGNSYIRIGDVSSAEGDSGTHAMTFTITRSGGSAAAASVDYTLNLTGGADASDLAPGTPLSGTVNFGVGDTTRTIVVNVVGDTAPEPNETFTITLANPTNGNPSYTTVISDGTGVGTIVNDDAITLHTYEVQGAGLVSDYVGQRVTTTGIVTAVGNSGFYIQDAAGDGNANTSDALFVATASKASLLVGDSVTVSGTIAEAGGSGALTVTQFAAGATVTLGTHSNTLPTAVLIGHDGLHPPTSIIDNDHLTTSDPTTDGIDFFETLEGMRVTIQAPQVVARTDTSETWVVASHGQDATGMNAAGGITVSAGDFNPEKILIDPTSDVSSAFSGTFSQGDQLADVTGILTYGTSSSNDVGYKVIPTSAAVLTNDITLMPEVTSLMGDATHLTIASFNMENADVGDGQAKFTLIAQNVVINLKAPDIIFAQEIQDADGAGTGTDYSGIATANAVINAIIAQGGPTYTYVEVAPTANNTTGGEPGGNIRPGYFYNAARVDYVAGSASQITGAAYDGSRKPLVAQFVFNGETITAIDVHATSRLGSDSLFGSYQPPLDGGDGSRTAQAQGVADYVHGLLQTNPNANVVVGGDFNGFYFEPAFTTLYNAGLTNLNSLIAVEERYSYLYNGNLEQIDNLLASAALMDGAQFDAVHINTLKATTDAMATDHDQVVTSLYIPLPNHAPTATGDSVGVNEDATTANLYAALLGNDSDPDAGTTLTITGVNTGGTLGHVIFDAGSHTLQYVADNDAFDTLPTGATASDSFTYTISDGTLTSTATVAVTVTGIADTVTWNGGSGADTKTGTGADDRLYGNAGNDSLAGGDGADFVSGGAGNDTMTGDGGNDYLLGGAGNDNITGGTGNDYLSGDAGNDFLTGGTGADTFAFGQAGGKDTVSDFDTALDRILLANGISVTNSLVSDVNRDGTMDLTLTFTSGTQTILLGVHDFAAVHIDRTNAPLMTDPVF
jgi:VCBS repeat-containing protein